MDESIYLQVANWCVKIGASWDDLVTFLLVHPHRHHHGKHDKYIMVQFNRCPSQSMGNPTKKKKKKRKKKKKKKDKKTEKKIVYKHHSSQLLSNENLKK